MGSSVKLVVLLGLLSSVVADFPLEDNENEMNRNTAQDTNYRIPEDLDPIHCEMEITPYFDTAPTGKDPFTFDGRVTHIVRTLTPNLSSLILQENVREVVSVSLYDASGTQEINLSTVPFERIREYHFLKINLPDGVTLANDTVYTLNIVYVGNINETPLSRGVFRGKYIGNDGKLHWYAATHLQPTNSRQAFPCFDEPGFKSTFDIIINRPSHFIQTYSNMPLKEEIVNGDRVKEIFYTTPRMSAYLVTFHISEEFTVIADNNNPQRSYRILARPNAAGQGEYALEVGPPINDWLEQYLGIEYYTMADNMKNDQIASPYWASGATENWGLVTYRELRLLYEEGETNALDKMYIGTITAHELAHKWFGNLITARWWDNVWVNEGFASYFEYFAMDSIDKSMELEDQFNIMYVQSALSSDSSASTRALQHEVNSPTQVTGHFSGISYSKGASMLLMLKHFVTEDVFKLGLNYFLTDRSYEYALPQDFFNAFDTVVNTTLPNNVNIAEFLRVWVEEPGYPVITVNVDRDNGVMKLKQERFFISASATQTDQKWPVPLTYTFGSNPNWENLTPAHVITGEEYEINESPGDSWVLFNVQQKGIYRVNYDVQNWQLLAKVLKSNYSSIHHLNRAQIVDDVFALARSGRMTYDLAFEVLDFLKQDTSYYSWYPAITGFSWLRNRLLHLPDKLSVFDEILHEYLDVVVKDLGYDVDVSEPLTRTLNRFFLMTFACNVGHSGCISNAVAKFNDLKNNNVKVNPNLRRHVYCEGLRNGDYDEWKLIYDLWRSSNNQASEVAMLRSLGCTTNDQARQEYLQMILDDDYTKAQDRPNAFSFLLMGDRSNAKVTLDFLKQHFDEIRSAVVLQAWFDGVISTVASYLDEDGLNDFESWLHENSASIPEYSIGISSINSARSNMQWGTANADIILDAARDTSSAISLIPTMLVIVMSILVTVL